MKFVRYLAEPRFNRIDMVGVAVASMCVGNGEYVASIVSAVVAGCLSVWAEMKAGNI